MLALPLTVHPNELSAAGITAPEGQNTVPRDGEMGEPDVVDAESFGERYRLARRLAGIGVEALGHERVLAHVEQVAGRGVLDPRPTGENGCALASVQRAHTNFGLVRTKGHVEKVAATGEKLRQPTWALFSSSGVTRGEGMPPEAATCMMGSVPVPS